jgi:regulation of enolase protein 1 (concanavalin A-like superfamily)
MRDIVGAEQKLCAAPFSRAQSVTFGGAILSPESASASAFFP